MLDFHKVYLQGYLYILGSKYARVVNLLWKQL